MEIGKQDIWNRLLEDSSLITDQPIESFSQWKQFIVANPMIESAPIDRAILLGIKSDRVAYAFVSGFYTALHFMFPGLDPRKFTAFCVTEKSGNRPLDIQSKLTPREEESNGETFVLNGHKTFITGATEADAILVAVSLGKDKKGKSKIKLIKLDRDKKGIEIKALEPFPFVPEIEHGEVRFKEVIVVQEEILPGDGYIKYVKPFRIIEEIHVIAALLGYLAKIVIHYKWDKSFLEQLGALILSLKALVERDLSDPSTHIGFSGFWQLFKSFLESMESQWALKQDKHYQNWVRDKSILKIAEKARQVRLKKAWNTYSIY